MTAVHGVTGILGSLGLGLLATSSVNPGGPDGAFYGHPAQLGYQAVGVLAAVLLSALFTFLILQLLRLTLGLRHEADSGPPPAASTRATMARLPMPPKRHWRLRVQRHRWARRSAGNAVNDDCVSM